MNDRKSIAGAAAVTLSAFLLFYLPSMLSLFARDMEPLDMTMLNIVMATCYSAIFCLNYFLFVPSLLFRHKKFLYFFINFAIIISVCSLLPLWFESHGGLPRPRHLRHVDLTVGQWVMGYLKFMIRDGIMMVLSIALAYAFRLSKDKENMERRMLQLEAVRRNAELLSLKAQLNPHFLFNSLNNIYALIAINTDKAQKALHDLSSLLRFLIYDAEEKTVSLDKELSFIMEYISLMKLRLNPSITLNCDIMEEDVSGYQIAPLLLLTLVENSFKHLDKSCPTPFISIEIGFKGDSMNCKVANSHSAASSSSDSSEHSGIGLRNISRQLSLIYPHSHSLEVDESDGIFTAVISIKREALKRDLQSYTA